MGLLRTEDCEQYEKCERVPFHQVSWLVSMPSRARSSLCVQELNSYAQSGEYSILARAALSPIPLSLVSPLAKETRLAGSNYRTNPTWGVRPCSSPYWPLDAHPHKISHLNTRGLLQEIVFLVLGGATSKGRGLRGLQLRPPCPTRRALSLRQHHPRRRSPRPPSPFPAWRSTHRVASDAGRSRSRAPDQIQPRQAHPWRACGDDG